MKVSIIGLGYVGLPLVIEAALHGHEVTGIDISSNVVNRLNAGRSHVDDVSDERIQAALSRNFVASTAYDSISTADTIVICVPTPLSHEGGPDLGPVRLAATETAKFLQTGALVVLESTTWPGTTQEVLAPLLEQSGKAAGRDFYLAFSPERIDPGNQRWELSNTPKVVGGLTPSCTERAIEFYSTIVDSVVVARGCGEAEMAKLLENTYRHVNIALVNEMAKFSYDLGLDIWDVIHCASTKPFGFQAFYPGPGVGGHCIPIDPNYLSFRVKAELGYPFRFVELAQEINQSMPKYVVSRTQALLNDLSKSVRGAKILICGVTYKPGVADQRESPALTIAGLLEHLGAQIEYWDNLVPEWQVGDLKYTRVGDLGKATQEADIVLVLHSDKWVANAVSVARATTVLDTRGTLDGPSVYKL